ncbi:hypothetical protein HZA33_04960 [Candidatus Pacearchaeota archaeon]|nr:hypothetical protein [Candidatus Pacearchaeota archaeon]
MEKECPECGQQIEPKTLMEKEIIVGGLNVFGLCSSISAPAMTNTRYDIYSCNCGYEKKERK